MSSGTAPGTGRGYHVDTLLPEIDSARLKQVARTYVGKIGAQMRKDEAVRAIRTALAEPTRLRGLYPGFTDVER